MERGDEVYRVYTKATPRGEHNDGLRRKEELNKNEEGRSEKEDENK